MQKKLVSLTQWGQLVLLIVLVSACRGGNSVERSNPVTSPKTISGTQAVLSAEKLSNFEKNLTSFISKLEKLTPSSDPVSTTTLVFSYKDISDGSVFFNTNNKAVFNSLEKLNSIAFEANFSEEVGALQKSLIDLNLLSIEGPTNQYASQTNKALIAFLKGLQQDVNTQKNKFQASASNPSTANKSDITPVTPESDKNVNERKMQDYIIPSLFGLTFLAVTAGLSIALLRFRKRLLLLENKRSELTSDLRTAIKNINKQAADQKNLFLEVDKLSQQIKVLQRTSTSTTSPSYYQQPVTPYTQSPAPPVQSFQVESPTANYPSHSETNIHSYHSHSIPQEDKSPLYLRLVKQYNEMPSSLASYAVGVSQTQESLKQNLQDSSQTSVILAQDNSPSYWIVKDEADDLWLFPREGWEASMGTLVSFVKLFKFTGNPSKRYRVIKPASVVESGQSCWRLKELGEIEFY